MARRKYTYSEMFQELVSGTVEVKSSYDPVTEMFTIECGTGEKFSGVDWDHTVESAWLWVEKDERPTEAGV